MAQTITQSDSSKARGQLFTANYLDTGTVGAYTFTCGFKPRYVRVLNVTSGDMEEWVEGMAAASAAKQVAAGTRTLITSNGITVSDTGFTVGLDTDINVTSEQLRIVAMA